MIFLSDCFNLRVHIFSLEFCTHERVIDVLIDILLRVYVIAFTNQGSLKNITNHNHEGILKSIEVYGVKGIV